MKLKPEYQKLLEIYPSLEHTLGVPTTFMGYVDVRNEVTSCYDKVWVEPSMLYSGYSYKTNDPLVQKLCEDSDFNEAFQKACAEQWDNYLGYITVNYCLGSYNTDVGYKNCICIYKKDIERKLV